MFDKNDKKQDQQLKDLWAWINHLNKNQAVLVKNNNFFIKRDKETATYIQGLQGRCKKLEADNAHLVNEVGIMKKRDEKLQAAISALGNLGGVSQTDDGATAET